VSCLSFDLDGKSYVTKNIYCRYKLIQDIEKNVYQLTLLICVVELLFVHLLRIFSQYI